MAEILSPARVSTMRHDLCAASLPALRRPHPPRVGDRNLQVGELGLTECDRPGFRKRAHCRLIETVRLGVAVCRSVRGGPMGLASAPPAGLCVPGFRSMCLPRWTLLWCGSKEGRTLSAGPV